MDPEEEGEPHDLCDIANMELEKYIPGITDTPKEKPPPEPTVRKIIILETWKESRQDIELMEMDTFAIRKTEVRKLEEENKQKEKNESKTPKVRKVRENYKSYTAKQVQKLIDLVICCGLSARKAGTLTDIAVRTAQHDVRQYNLKADSGWLPSMKRSHLEGNNQKLNKDHTNFLKTMHRLCCGRHAMHYTLNFQHYPSIYPISTSI